MGQLPVHLVGDGALLQHHHHGIGLFRQRRHVKVDQPVAGIARRAEIDLVFVDRGAARAHLLDQREQGTAERHQVAQQMPPQMRHRDFEKSLRRGIGVGHLAVRRYDDDGMRQRIEHHIGRRRREQVFRGAHAACPPCRIGVAEFVKSFGKPVQHNRGIVGGEHAAAMRLEQMRRRAGGRRRRIERPAEMFARVAQPNRDAVMGEHFAVKRAGERELLAECRRGLAFAGREIVRELAGKPRPALGAAPDHHRVGARGGKRRVGVIKALDVAIDDHGDRHGVLDGAHRRPVGAPFVELAARAAVHGDKPHAGLFGTPRQLRRVARTVVPAEPHFQGDRHLDRLHHRVDQGERVIEIAHQRRTGFAIGDVLGRTAHIDIDDGGAGSFGHARAFGHPARFAAGKLNHMQSRAMILDPQCGIALSVGECRASGHFRDDEARALVRNLSAERRIGDPRHGCQKHGIWHR